MNIDLRPAIYAIFVAAAMIGFLVWSGMKIIDDGSIESNKPIIPDVEILIKNGVSDTLYIYKRP